MTDSKWKELTENEARFLGRVVGEPQITQTANGECAWVNLKTTIDELAANGQYVESEQIIPLLIMDASKVNVVKQYVKDGRQLMVKCYYKAWKYENQSYHGLVVMQMKLGHTANQPKT